MDNRSFSKIWMLVIVPIIIVGGIILSLKYLSGEVGAIVIIVIVFSSSGLFLVYMVRGYEKVISLSLLCKKCGHIFKPGYFGGKTAVMLSNRDAFFYSFFNVPVFTKCPKCGKRSWKKTIKNAGIKNGNK